MAFWKCPMYYLFGLKKFYPYCGTSLHFVLQPLVEFECKKGLCQSDVRIVLCSQVLTFPSKEYLFSILISLFH